jgi:hypothetical protein
MVYIKIAVSTVIWVTILSFHLDDAQSAELNAIDELKVCARIENADDRHACYDDLGKLALAEEAEALESFPVVVKVPAETAAATELVAVTSAQTAAENPALQQSEDDKKKPIYGHVRSCQESSDNRWFFIFANGDVWKQSGGTVRRFSDCDFDVVIRKDLFGYKMTIEGDDKRVRVRRHN